MQLEDRRTKLALAGALMMALGATLSPWLLGPRTEAIEALAPAVAPDLAPDAATDLAPGTSSASPLAAPSRRQASFAESGDSSARPGEMLASVVEPGAPSTKDPGAVREPMSVGPEDEVCDPGTAGDSPLGAGPLAVEETRPVKPASNAFSERAFRARLARWAGFDSCKTAGLSRVASGGSGVLRLLLTIGRDGSVLASEVTGASGAGARRIADCVARSAKTLRFPKLAHADSVRQVATFVF